jgi:tripartite-type tricarboxylate transporter receptor subunit TctC
MRRREFIAGVGSAAAWPVAVRAQQAAAPMVGYTGINAALNDTKIKAQMADQGAVPLVGKPAEFADFIVAFNDKWSKVIKTAGIKL